VPAFAKPVDDAVLEAVGQHKMPGAVVVIGRHDRVLFRRAYGLRAIDPDPTPMTLDTVFDLTSLTKPVATATSIMVLVERGKVGLDDPLVRYVPECAGGGKSAITLRHLLLHIAGLPAGTPKDDYAHGHDEAIRRICNLTLRKVPGTDSTYTDVGFILLEEVVRRVTSQDLAAFARDAIFAPLGMNETGFNPQGQLRLRAAPTEIRDEEWMLGEVHDPRAYSLGGVAGHAGLFSTADDLALYARAILGDGEVAGRRVLARGTVEAMLAPHDVPDGIRALGWGVQSRYRGGGPLAARGRAPRLDGDLTLDGSRQGPVRAPLEQPRSPGRDG
jgi:CubicO group peptidase (beta-lactamase class C family)